MAKAGYCAACKADVWVREDGCCQNGHSADGISGIRDAVPVASPHAAPVERAKPKHRRLLIGGVVAAVLLILGLCTAVVIVGMPFLSQGAAATDEWKTRLAQDYPGWTAVSFNVRTFSGSSGPSTEYAFGLVPPGRKFAVGVVYKSEGGQPAVSQDEMLRPGSQYNDRAEALLDFIEREYVDQGRDVVSVTTDADGSATVTWQKVTKVAFFTSRIGSFDILSYNEASGTWSAPTGSTP